MTSSLTDPHPLTAYGAVGQHILVALENDRLASSYLIEGADPDTLDEAARVIAASIVAGAPPAAPTGRTFELARSGRHPDVHRLERDKATVISVAALTATLERAHAKPLEADRQVFVVDPADAMEPEGIARYLKTLEEPPSGTVFLLLTTHADRLPPTVLSRCARLRFPPLRSEHVAERLRADGVETEEAARIGRVSAGSLTRARRIAATGLLALTDALVAAAEDEPSRVARVVEAVRSAVEIAAKERAATATVDRGREVVRNLLADILFVLSVEARERAAGRPSALADGTSPAEAVHLLEALAELSVAVRRNVSPAVILIEAAARLRGI